MTSTFTYHIVPFQIPIFFVWCRFSFKVIIAYIRGTIKILNHYNNRGLFCDPNIIANNKERCFRNPAIANYNSSQTLKLLRYHNICTRIIASPSQLPNLIQSQNFSDYNCFYPLFAINITSETICSKPITATI